MGIIDRLILRTFIKVFFVCFLSLTGLFIVIDLFGNLDEFLEISEQQGGLISLLCDYYGARSLAFFDRTSALMALVAATFTVTGLQRSNELAALMAAGISKMKVVVPLIAGVVVVSGLAAANREFLLPQFRDKLMRNAQDWRGDMQKELQPKYDNKTDILIGGRFTVAAEQQIVSPTFRLPGGIAQFGSLLAAENAYYQKPQSGRPGGYLLDGMKQPGDLEDSESVYIKNQPVILVPADTPWVKEDQCFVASDVTFDQLAAGSAWRQYSSTPELITSLHNPSLDFGADVRVAVHGRLVQPVLDVTLLFLGLPLVLSRESRNIFVAAGMCVLVVAVFFVVIIGCQAAGNSSLISPSLAAWCPLIMFVPAARFLSAAFYS